MTLLRLLLTSTLNINFDPDHETLSSKPTGRDT